LLPTTLPSASPLAEMVAISGPRSAAPLKDVTAVFYDEDRNEIYTGNKHGLLHLWSNSSGFIFRKL